MSFFAASKERSLVAESFPLISWQPLFALSLR